MPEEELVSVIVVGVDALNYKDENGNTDCAFRGDKPRSIPKRLATSGHWKIVEGDVAAAVLPPEPNVADEKLVDDLALLAKLSPEELVELAKLTPEDIALLGENAAPPGMEMTVIELKARLRELADAPTALAEFALKIYNAEMVRDPRRATVLDLVTPIVSKDSVVTIN